jgi:polyhydroxybutyrate depolymerase
VARDPALLKRIGCSEEPPSAHQPAQPSRREKDVRTLKRFFNMSGIAVVLACAFLSMPSFGHAAADCTTPAMARGWQVVTVHSGGLNRDVPLYIPASAAGRSDIPLVFDLHGSGRNGRQQALRSGLTALADRHGFLLANPNGGIADPDSPTDKFYWHVPGVPLSDSVQMPANAPDDVQFFRDAIRQLEQAACVDPRRIYVTGFSGGGRMASALACELSDRIAATAPVSGLRAGVPRAGDFKAPDTKTCEPHRAISIITFHGVHDPTNRFDGDGEPRWGYSVHAALERWGYIDGCQGNPSEQMVSPHVTKVTYQGCRQTAELILYRTDAPVEHGGGHIWPHSSTSAQESTLAAEQVDQLDASALIWEFFSRHQL